MLYCCNVNTPAKCLKMPQDAFSLKKISSIIHKSSPVQLDCPNQRWFTVNLNLCPLGCPGPVHLNVPVPLIWTHPNIRTHIVHFDKNLAFQMNGLTPCAWTIQIHVSGPTIRTNLECLIGWFKYTVTDRPNERGSNGSSMLRKFGPSKLTTVQWTAYVTSFWTVQNYGHGPLFWTVQKYGFGP